MLNFADFCFEKDFRHISLNGIYQNTYSSQSAEVMLKYTELKYNAEQFLSLTSLTVEEFESLLIDFTYAWEYQMRYFTFDGKPRERKYHEKRNALLPQIADKLFFVLYYLKNNPLQQALGASFGMSQPQANIYLHKYHAILQEALKRQNCTPVRQGSALTKLLTDNGNTDFYTDGVERDIPRSVDWETQQEYFSGKKKRHTQKNTIFSGPDGEIYYLSDSHEGKTHDKTINDQTQVKLPDNSRCFQDTGFLGYTPKGKNIQVIMPVKKPKGKALTKEQKEMNTLIAKVRVKVEHVMSGIKRLRIIKEKVRAFANDFRDHVMLTACALHNLRLRFRPWTYPEPDKILQK